MAEKISRFEDLIAWQKARAFCANVHRLTASGRLEKNYGFRDQIQRAAVSIMSNLAEGFERASRKDFHKFIVIAKGSCAEARSLFYVALDADLITKADFHKASKDAEELARILGGLRSAVSKQIPGADRQRTKSPAPSPQATVLKKQ